MELSAAQKRERKAQGPRTRLTAKLTKDVAAAVETAMPMALVADLVGVNRGTLSEWMQRGAAAERKRYDQREQMDRLCLVFVQEVRLAQGRAASRVHQPIAKAAGMFGPQYVSKTTKRTGADGTVELVEEKIELRPDWRAAAHLGEVRFPLELGGVPEPEPDRPAGVDLSPEQLMDRIRQIARQRQDAGLDADIVDAEIVG